MSERQNITPDWQNNEGQKTSALLKLKRLREVQRAQVKRLFNEADSLMKKPGKHELALLDQLEGLNDQLSGKICQINYLEIKILELTDEAHLNEENEVSSDYQAEMYKQNRCISTFVRKNRLETQKCSDRSLSLEVSRMIKTLHVDKSGLDNTAEDLYGDYPSMNVSTQSYVTDDKFLEVQDAPNGSAVEDGYSSDRKEVEEDKFILLVEQGNVEKIREMQSQNYDEFHDLSERKFKVRGMEKTPLQIASEKGCFQMVHLLKKAQNITVNNITDISASDFGAKISKTSAEMVAKANPAYLCLKEDDPVKSALKWPSEFKKVFGLANTLQILQGKYLFGSRQVTLFTERLLNCCVNDSETRILLNGNASHEERGAVFLHKKLKLVTFAVHKRQEGLVAHRKTQLELRRQWLYGEPQWCRKRGNSWLWLFFYCFCCFVFYGLLHPVLPLVYVIPCPYLRKLISCPKGKLLAEQASALLFAIALFAYEIFDYRHPIVFSFLVCWIVGSLVCETIQIINTGPVFYFSDVWNILDVLVIITFAAGVLVRDYFMLGSSFLYLQKLPAITLVCVMLRGMNNLYLSELLGKMFLIFVEIKTEVFRFLAIFAFVVLAFACSFYLLYYDVNNGIFTPFSTFELTLLHLLMKVFSETRKIDYMPLMTQNNTLGGAKRNGTSTIDASGIYDFFGFALYIIFLTMSYLILLTLCVAMMTNKYRKLEENILKVWYVKQSEICLYYIRQKIIFPPPYNLLEIFVRKLIDAKQDYCSAKKRNKQAEDAENCQDSCTVEERNNKAYDLESCQDSCSAEERNNQADDVERCQDSYSMEERNTQADDVGSCQKNGRQENCPLSYEQLMTVLKARYYKAYGCNDCKIHGPGEG
ncbi:short transient receptor potential channel 5-like [Ptychodera flava]|uniref:short transient receptor potential channel 5-like n=1 Tax=Ptychodera flava TaxID=63121 RepID=UPI00396A2795